MLLTLALVGLALTQETDTTFAVSPGTRLDVNNQGGEIVVRAWNENRVRLRASHSSRDRVEIDVSGSVVTVRSTGRHGISQLVDYDISVPQWMAVNLSGIYTDMTIEGTNAAVTVETVEGDIELRGGNGTVTLQSVEGAVTVSDTRGRVDVNSVEGEIRITGASGEIVAETVDGDIVLERIESASVEVNSVDGDIYYDGTISNNGRYHIATHDGDLTVAIPERANVTVTVSSFDGEFDSSFPVQLREQHKRRFSFVIGTGSARLELETFDGDILLRRPAEMRSSRDRDRDREHNRNRDHKDNY
jgi:putative adhesin